MKRWQFEIPSLLFPPAYSSPGLMSLGSNPTFYAACFETVGQLVCNFFIMGCVRYENRDGHSKDILYQ